MRNAVVIRSSPQIRGDQAALVKEIKSSVADLREVKAMGDGFRATFDGASGRATAGVSCSATALAERFASIPIACMIANGPISQPNPHRITRSTSSDE